MTLLNLVLLLGFIALLLFSIAADNAKLCAVLAIVTLLYNLFPFDRASNCKNINATDKRENETIKETIHNESNTMSKATCSEFTIRKQAFDGLVEASLPMVYQDKTEQYTLEIFQDKSKQFSIKAVLDLNLTSSHHHARANQILADFKGREKWDIYERIDVNSTNDGMIDAHCFLGGSCFVSGCGSHIRYTSGKDYGIAYSIHNNLIPKSHGIKIEVSGWRFNETRSGCRITHIFEASLDKSVLESAIDYFINRVISSSQERLSKLILRNKCKDKNEDTSDLNRITGGLVIKPHLHTSLKIIWFIHKNLKVYRPWFLLFTVIAILIKKR